MTEKQIALSNLNRKQRMARRRVLAREADERLVASGCDVSKWSKPVPLANPIEFPASLSPVK